MRCEDLDRLRMESSSLSSTWPPEAQEHLLSCRQCASLQALLDRNTKTEAPEAGWGRIESAILPGLQPVSPIPSVFRVMAGLLVSLIVVVAASNWRVGIEGWQARSAFQATLNFSLLGLSVLLLASVLAYQMMPGSRQPVPFLAYMTAPLLALLASNSALFGYHWTPRFVPVGLHCWEIGVTCAALSAPLFWLILRRGWSLHPVANGATVGLLAGLVGITVLEIYCPYLDRLHISVWHIGAGVTSTLAGAALGAIRAYREG